jgi:hypothetical protein
MNCPYCGAEMKEGFLYGSKDGAFSFSEEVPGVFTNAKTAKGYIAITGLKAGKRTNIKAAVCEKCRKLIASY